MGDVTVGAQPGKGEPEGSEPKPADHGSGSPPPRRDATPPPRRDATPPPPRGDATPPPPAEGSGGVGEEEKSLSDDGGGKHRAKRQRSFWRELPILVGVALVLALIIKTFLLQAFSIPSDSMQDTLQRGDRVLVDKLTPWFGSEPERGEVVVFHDPNDWLGPQSETEQGGLSSAIRTGLSAVGLMPSAENNDLIKRVIAVGGDTVGCQRGGPVTVNGVPLDEDGYIYPGNTPCDDRPFGPVTIRDGHIWVMGDHRQDSQDSRYHQDLPGGGTVPVSEVVGRAVVVAWPPTHWSFLSVPGTFDQSGINSALAAGTPAALGLLGAVPLVWWRRRRLLARATPAGCAKGKRAARTEGVAEAGTDGRGAARRS